MKKLLLLCTFMMSGRMMTIAYLGAAGSSSSGAPPAAWLMPLIGDAVIGLSALYVAYLIWRRQGFKVWMTAVVWNFLGLWDALSAFIIHRTNPWPEFFMIEAFGAAMFFMAAAIHVLMLWMLYRGTLRPHHY